MILVEREPDSMSCLGSERCCFCRQITAYWNKIKDVPICLGCASVFEFEEVPTKQEWFEREDKIEKGRLTTTHERAYIQSRLRKKS